MLIRADGHGIPNLLTAIMKVRTHFKIEQGGCLTLSIFKFFPLDEHVYSPVMLMDLVNKDKNNGMKDPAVWETYQGISKLKINQNAENPVIWSQ